MDGPSELGKVQELAARWPEPVASLIERCIAIQQIPAPTGAEGARAAWVRAEMDALGLHDVTQDGLHNVMGRWPGRQAAPALLVSAHTDTVFGPETDLRVRYDTADGKLHGPGIGDNSVGVAALLGLAQVLPLLPPLPVDLWLVANSQEEGLGDLRGMRAVMDRLQSQVGACVVIEGMGLGRVVHRALGSRRFRIAAQAPGGHSWSDYGTASALHVLAQLAADLTRLHPPETPRTTFNIGRMEGGTSVNTIAQHAWLELDLRSEGQMTLAQMVEAVTEIVARYQQPKWTRRGVQVEMTPIGDRPPGEIPAQHPLVVAATQSLAAVGYPYSADLRISSTDANIPLSRGIPAVCIGVTEGANAHRLQEWVLTRPLAQGMAHLLLLTWRAAAWLAGGASGGASGGKAAS